MEKKYQVFISSTYTDLQEERQCAISCLLDMNCIPVGMEQFPASSLSQWDYIKKMIDMSDYYVLIVAGKYGSIDPEENISYTEKEYNYAVSKKMPILTFLFNDISKIVGEKLEDSDTGRKLVEEFRNKLTNANRLVKFYSSIDDLKSKITAAMYQAIIDTPAVGWVRGDKIERSTNDDLMARVKSLERNQVTSFPVGVVSNYHPDMFITSDLPEESINLLLEIAEDPYGQVDVTKTVYGTFFTTKGEELNEDGFGKEVAFWENAIDMLISKGLARRENLDAGNMIIQLTKQGYELAERLNHKTQ